MKIQFVWWGGSPHIGWWEYPPREARAKNNVRLPIFYGLDLGLFEIRLFPISPKSLQEIENTRQGEKAPQAKP